MHREQLQARAAVRAETAAPDSSIATDDLIAFSDTSPSPSPLPPPPPPQTFDFVRAGDSIPRQFSTVTAAVVVAATAASLPQTDAHTYVMQPLAEFKKGASKSSWVAEFGPAWAGTFRTGAQYNVERKKRGVKTLRSFLESKGPVCGNSLSNAKRKPIPRDGLIKFGSSMEHPGPCEIWFDNTRVFAEVDCEKRFGSATQFKINYSKCKGNCMLRFYWLGLQDGGKRWQSYKNCVPIGNGKRMLEEGDDEIDTEEDQWVDDIDLDFEVLDGDDDATPEDADESEFEADVAYNGTVSETD